MALKRDSKYPNRFGDDTTQSPSGSFKNKTDSSTNDGSFLEQDWANDWYDGLSGAFISNVHQGDGNPTGYVEPTFDANSRANGTVDNAQASQVYNAWYKKTQDVADGRIAAKQLEEKIAELEAIADGCWFNYYNGPTGLNTNTTRTSTTYFSDLDFSEPTQSHDPIYLGNNITIDSDDGSVLNFAKAGTYQFNFCYFRSLDTMGAPNRLKITMNKPTNDQSVDNGFISYFGSGKSLSLEPYEVLNYESGVNYQNRNQGVDIIATTPSSIPPQEMVLRFGTLFPVVYIVSDEDNFKLKFQLKTGNAVPFNFATSFNRVGGATLSSPYMSPIDYVEDDD